MRERKKIGNVLGHKKICCCCYGEARMKIFSFHFSIPPFLHSHGPSEWEERHHRNVKFSLSLSTVHTMFNIIMDRWYEVESKSEGGMWSWSDEENKKIYIKNSDVSLFHSHTFSLLNLDVRLEILLALAYIDRDLKYSIKHSPIYILRGLFFLECVDRYILYLERDIWENLRLLSHSHNESGEKLPLSLFLYKFLREELSIFYTCWWYTVELQKTFLCNCVSFLCPFFLLALTPLNEWTAASKLFHVTLSLPPPHNKKLPACLTMRKKNKRKI